MTLRKETVADFSEKLGFLLSSGVPLVSSLESILAEIQDHDLGACLHHVLARIKEGGRFSEAMGDFPHLFSPSYLGMVRSAENQGILDTMMPKTAQGVRSGLIPVGIVPSPGEWTVPKFLRGPAS